MKVGTEAHKMCGYEEPIVESISELLCYHDIKPEITLEVDVWVYKGKMKIQTYEDESGDIDYYILTNPDGTDNTKAP